MMEAHLPRLDGKYYRTEMFVVLDDGTKVDIELSTIEDNEPSSREKEANWERYESGELPCDGHYERRATLLVAKEIVRRLNDTSAR